jgi:hypothetical protein
MEEQQLYDLVHSVADMAYDYASANSGGSLFLSDRRGEGINPLQHQTEQGLFLELYAGIPGKLWTPWGEWVCWGSGSGSWQHAMPIFLSRLGAKVHIAGPIKSRQHYGTVYAINRIDMQDLPEPVERSQDSYLKYEDVIDIWQRLSA